MWHYSIKQFNYQTGQFEFYSHGVSTEHEGWEVVFANAEQFRLVEAPRKFGQVRHGMRATLTDRATREVVFVARVFEDGNPEQHEPLPGEPLEYEDLASPLDSED
jgi:hypothetical protein